MSSEHLSGAEHFPGVGAHQFLGNIAGRAVEYIFKSAAYIGATVLGRQ